MSYCRFAWDGSDVYVYESADGFECCGCGLNPAEPVTLASPEAMIIHLVEHRKAGQFVPEYAIRGLWSEVSGASKPSRPMPKVLAKSQRMMHDAIDEVTVKSFSKRRKIPLSHQATLRLFLNWQRKAGRDV